MSNARILGFKSWMFAKLYFTPFASFALGKFQNGVAKYTVVSDSTKLWLLALVNSTQVKQFLEICSFSFEQVDCFYFLVNLHGKYKSFLNSVPISHESM